MEPVIITCAVTGGDDAVLEKHPRIPKTPSEIAEACLAAAEAGAAVVHIHVRDPETGLATSKTELYAEVVEEIKRSNKDVLINLTGGCEGDVVFTETDPPQLDPSSDLRSAEVRVRHIVELKPDLASLDVGVAGTEESFYVIRPSEARYMAEAMRAAGVKPELECFEFGHIEIALKLIKDGVVEDPPMFQLCLGTGSGAPGDPKVLQHLVSRLPHDCVWGAFGCGRTEMPIAATAAVMGGNVRVGLEDNIYLKKGVLADNQDLVRNAAEIIDRVGYTVATPDDARRRLNLKPRTA
ncbi:MAG: 3-keto-5-aminohexanoate cleavage protein [Pseudomonadota bacterium]